MKSLSLKDVHPEQWEVSFETIPKKKKKKEVSRILQVSKPKERSISPSLD